MQVDRADGKFRSNTYYKVWLCLLRNLNDAKEERARGRQEERARQVAREGQPMVNVRPHIDKILPEDLEQYWGQEEPRRGEEVLRAAVGNPDAPYEGSNDVAGPWAGQQDLVGTA